MLPVNSIICGAMPEATKDWPSESVNCSISSPPFWALRDYGVEPIFWGGKEDCNHKWEFVQGKKMGGGTHGIAPEYNEERKFDAKSNFCSKCDGWLGQLGLEPTFELYIEHLCTIYDEVWRVLRKDGTCWVNLGDTYGTSSGAGSRSAYKQGTNKGSYYYEGKGKPGVRGLEKSLCGIPEMFVLEMQKRGWIRRNTIIWHKPNPMPSSAKDRFTVDFEYVFFFVKSKKYWFEPQYEPYLTESNAERRRMGQGNQTKYMQKRSQYMGGAGSSWQGHSGTLKADGTQIQSNPLGRNKRCVWTIPTQPYGEAHFATFPEKLVEPMIKAGCPEFICTKCGKAREKIFEGKSIDAFNVGARDKKAGRFQDKWGDTQKPRPHYEKYKGDKDFAGEGRYFKGYTDCSCNADWRPGIVLDCFCGQWDDFTGSLQIAA